MSFNENTTHCPAFATKADAPFIRIDLSPIRSMTIAHLNALHEAVLVIQQAVAGVSCWPLFSGEDDAAGEMLSHLAESFSGVRGEIESAIELSRPQGAAEVASSAWAMLRTQVEMAESLEAVAAIATAALQDVDRLRRRERKREAYS